MNLIYIKVLILICLIEYAFNARLLPEKDLNQHYFDFCFKKFKFVSKIVLVFVYLNNKIVKNLDLRH